jgi:hypothetical protein
MIYVAANATGVATAVARAAVRIRCHRRVFWYLGKSLSPWKLDRSGSANCANTSGPKRMALLH